MSDMERSSLDDVYLHEGVFLAFRRRPATVRSALVCPLGIPPALCHLAVEYATPPTTLPKAGEGDIYIRQNHGTFHESCGYFHASLDDPSSTVALYEHISEINSRLKFVVCCGRPIPKADGWSLADCGVSKESTVHALTSYRMATHSDVLDPYCVEFFDATSNIPDPLPVLKADMGMVASVSVTGMTYHGKRVCGLGVFVGWEDVYVAFRRRPLTVRDCLVLMAPSDTPWVSIPMDTLRTVLEYATPFAADAVFDATGPPLGILLKNGVPWFDLFQRDLTQLILPTLPRQWI